MAITIEQAFESLDDSIVRLGQLYHLQALSQESLSDEGQKMLRLATEQCSQSFQDMISVEASIADWISIAWRKIKEAIAYIWNMLKSIFAEDHDEKELKKSKMRQDKVKEILETAGHNVKFDESAYLDTSLARHFEYHKESIVYGQLVIDQAAALEAIIGYLKMIAEAALQAQDMVRQHLPTLIQAGQPISALGLLITQVMEPAIEQQTFHQVIDRSAYQGLQVDMKDVNFGNSGYLDIMLGNRKLFILDVQPTRTTHHYKLKVSEDPHLKAHDVKVAYFKAQELGDYMIVLDRVTHSLLETQDTLVRLTNVAQRTSKDTLAIIEGLFIKEPENAQRTLEAASLLLKTAIQPFFDSIACLKQIKRDLAVHAAIQDANINHYKT